MKAAYRIAVAIDKAKGTDASCLVVGKVMGDHVEIIECYSTRDPKKFAKKIESLKKKYTGAQVIEEK